MSRPRKPAVRVPRLKPVAACAAALFALCAPGAAIAATWTVNSCDEGNSGDLPSKSGTLRFAAANAASGDTIDMSGLACSEITLATGAITLGQDSVSIIGPGANNLAISGKYNGVSTDRVLRHAGFGTLYVSGLTLEFGTANDAVPIPRVGGCILSNGSVTLNDVQAALCGAYSATNGAGGGVVAAYGDVVVKSSTLAYNFAHSKTGNARGGAVLTLSRFTARYSTIDNNQALGDGGSFGGGVVAYGDLTLRHSTISRNYCTGNVGGIAAFHYSTVPTSVYIASSTISDNQTPGLIGGLVTNANSVRMYNSTIAFNTAGAGRTGTSPTYAYAAPGLALQTLNGPVSVTLQSSILSNNTYGSSEVDLSATGNYPAIFNAAPANNLVRTSVGVNLPPDTLTGACPLLGPLRDNGGATWTHALLSHSLAIDAGNDSNAETFDQRGPGYARVSNGTADIGAYEVDQNDVVFNNGFEGCPVLF